MPALLVAYETDGVTPLASPFSFDPTDPGSPSAQRDFRVQNDGTEEAAAPDLYLHQVDPATTEQVAFGLRAVDEGWVEFRADGTAHADVAQPDTGWRPAGYGRQLRLAPLGPGEWVEVSARFNPPGTGSGANPEFLIHVESDGRSYAIGDGHTEATRPGLVSPLGRRHELRYGGGIAEDSPASNDVLLGDASWVDANGVPHVRLEALLTIGPNDSTSNPPAAGEAYQARVSLGTSTTPTITKGVRDTIGSLGEPPAAPYGEVDLGWVLVDDTGVIATADITEEAVAGLAEPVVSSGLQILVGPRVSLVNNSLRSVPGQTPLSLPDSETCSIWLIRAGTLAVTTDGTPPEPGALLLYEIPTDPTDADLAAMVDHREPIGIEVIRLDFYLPGTVTDADTVRLVYPVGRRGWIRAPRGLALTVDDPGSGNAAGQFAVDLSIDGTTAFTSSGSDDRRPELAWDDSPAVDHDDFRRASDEPRILPEGLAVPPFALLTATVAELVAFDGTAPSGARLAVLVEVP
jgi:hypothetical protein